MEDIKSLAKQIKGIEDRMERMADDCPSVDQKIEVYNRFAALLMDLRVQKQKLNTLRLVHDEKIARMRETRKRDFRALKRQRKEDEEQKKLAEARDAEKRLVLEKRRRARNEAKKKYRLTARESGVTRKGTGVHITGAQWLEERNKDRDASRKAKKTVEMLTELNKLDLAARKGPPVPEEEKSQEPVEEESEEEDIDNAVEEMSDGYGTELSEVDDEKEDGF